MQVTQYTILHVHAALFWYTVHYLLMCAFNMHFKTLIAQRMGSKRTSMLIKCI